MLDNFRPMFGQAGAKAAELGRTHRNSMALGEFSAIVGPSGAERITTLLCVAAEFSRQVGPASVAGCGPLSLGRTPTHDLRKVIGRHPPGAPRPCNPPGAEEAKSQRCLFESGLGSMGTVCAEAGPASALPQLVR